MPSIDLKNVGSELVLRSRLRAWLSVTTAASRWRRKQEGMAGSH